MKTLLMSSLVLVTLVTLVSDWILVSGETGDRKHGAVVPSSLPSSLLPSLPSLRRATSLCRCGHSSDSALQTHAAVIGGRESDPGSFPWIAGLLDSYGFNFCAGALIRRNTVLTAAHCVYNKKPRDLSVVIGFADLDLAYLYNRAHRVLDIVVHPRFVHSNWSHDIALIQLADRVGAQQPICLPARSERSFDDLLVAGWGRTTASPNSIKPNRLHQVALPQVEQWKCEQKWAENYVGSDQMCAGAAGKDTCIYDSGSPLMSRRTEDSGRRSTVLAGVTSFGSKRCGDPEKPGVYTRVASYLPWIEFHTRNSPSC